jgi:3-dehydroquinate synthetase
MNYQIPHGLAVAMGMTAETLLSAKMGMLDEKNKARILDLLRQYGLPMRIPSHLDIDGLIALIHSDKKALDGQIAIALPTHIGNATVRPNIPAGLVREALGEIQA